MKPARTSVSKLVSLLSIFAVCACSTEADREQAATWEAVHDTIGDTVIVHTVSGSVWGDTAILVPEVSIGMLEGPEEYTFGQVYSLAQGDDGTIFVVDR
ncbi:MAG: hypothetical protein M8841_05900, partial [marine benthic group bacterium]|nr:hypothetical protein [Gemmatimonadota bacterium]MCL7938077.1 hypothetical protein [Gemmatimonadota bacterium]